MKINAANHSIDKTPFILKKSVLRPYSNFLWSLFLSSFVMSVSISCAHAHDLKEVDLFSQSANPFAQFSPQLHNHSVSDIYKMSKSKMSKTVNRVDEIDLENINKENINKENNKEESEDKLGPEQGNKDKPEIKKSNPNSARKNQF